VQTASEQTVAPEGIVEWELHCKRSRSAMEFDDRLSGEVAAYQVEQFCGQVFESIWFSRVFGQPSRNIYLTWRRLEYIKHERIQLWHIDRIGIKSLHVVSKDQGECCFPTSYSPPHHSSLDKLRTLRGPYTAEHSHRSNMSFSVFSAICVYRSASRSESRWRSRKRLFKK
jgi:hypothetical protein